MNTEEVKLSKKERKELARQAQKTQFEKEKQMAAFKKWGIILLIIALIGGGLWWGYHKLSKPLPGTQVEDIGRNHISDISNVSYNSNPPTSGSHFPVWAKRGVYDRVISDGYLIHSLEHGYVVASYNCEEKVSRVPRVPQVSRAYAQEEGDVIGPPAPAKELPLTKMNVSVTGAMSAFTPESPPAIEVELPESFQSDSCKKLVSDLSIFLNNYQRLIIVPRPNLDTAIALTSWGRIDKFDKFDRERIEQFISAYHNNGPEKTVE